MLKLQAREGSDPAVTPTLEKAAYRVSAVAKAHERIRQGNGPDRLDLGIYVRDVCKDLNDAAPLRRIEVTAESGIMVMTDRAIPIALMINEVINNAAKYAYHDDLIWNICDRVARSV